MKSTLLVLLLLAITASAQDPAPIVGGLELRSPASRPAASGAGGWLRCGLPLRRGAEVTNLDELRLERADGTPVVADLEVLTRRGAALNDETAPIDWIAVSFAPGPGDGTTFSLRPGKRPSGRLEVRENEGQIEVLRGDLRFRLDPQEPAILRSLMRGDEELLGSPALQPFLINAAGKLVAPEPWQLVFERRSDAAVVILARTKLADLVFELRLHWVSESTEMVVDLRLVNEGPYGHMGSRSEHRYFKSLDLSLPVPRAATELSDELGTIERPNSWALLQQHEMPFKTGEPAESFPAQLWADGALRRSYWRAHGFVALSSKTLGIGVQVEDFWQDAPKNLALHGEELFCGIFPSGGNGPEYRGIYGRPPSEGEVDPESLEAYRFEGARAKSHRIRIAISSTSSAEISKSMAAGADLDLGAVPDRESLSGLRLMGYRLETGLLVNSAAVARFERFARVLVDDGAADAQDSLGQIGLPGFIERGGTYGVQPQRGWFNHGDIAWGDGYSSLHYDLPFSLLFHFLRSGDARFLAVGCDMARHRRDIDQDHDRRSGFKLAGGQFYEKGHYHGNYYHPSISHTWLRGPLLHWLLTGDRWSLEAAELNRDFLARSDIGRWDGNWGSRIPGWAADQSLALYEIFRDPADLARAEAALAAYEKVETGRDGGRGFVINRQMQPPSCQPWMIAIVGIAAAEHGLLTGSKRFRGLTERIGGFLSGPALQDPDAAFPKVFRTYSEKRREDPEHQLGWALSAFFALAGELLEDPEQSALARRLFASAVLHQGEKMGSPVAFRMLAYPNSESKIHGTMQIWGLLGLGAFP